MMSQHLMITGASYRVVQSVWVAARQTTVRAFFSRARVKDLPKLLTLIYEWPGELELVNFEF